MNHNYIQKIPIVITFLIFSILMSCNEQANPVGIIPETIYGSGVTDIDGNEYPTVIIGTQEWTTVNLRVTRYNDGTEIPYVQDREQWGAITNTAAYCYQTYSLNHEKWGAYYNWYAVETGKLAPEGWRVPTNDDWIELDKYMSANGYSSDGTRSSSSDRIAKSLAAQTDWDSSTYDGAVGNDLSKNNISGFSALPGNYRHVSGYFDPFGTYGNWWSSTKRDDTHAYLRFLKNTSKYLESVSLLFSYWAWPKTSGLSVRLVRNVE